MNTMESSPGNAPETKLNPDCSCGRCQLARELRENRLVTLSHLCRMLKISETNEAAMNNRNELLKLITRIRDLAHSKMLSAMKFEEQPDELIRELQESYRNGLREALSGLANASGAISTLAQLRVADEKADNLTEAIESMKVGDGQST